MFDVLLMNGTIFDGTTSKSYQGYVGIIKDTIVYVGKQRPTAAAKYSIDAYGLCLAPGFIDVHSHTDDWYLTNPHAVSKILQGVTTEIVGNCGDSAAPYGKWESVQDYKHTLLQQGIGLNVGTLVGHGKIRNAIISDCQSIVNSNQILAMKKILLEAMNQGALGLSTGLIYAPGCFASKEEITDLCNLVAQKNGIYATHMRDEGNNLETSIAETLSLCKHSKVKVIISHLKAKGKQNWGKIAFIIKTLQHARKDGLDIYCDVYPYDALNTNLKTLLPNWVLKNNKENMLDILRNDALFDKIIPIITENADHDFSKIFITGLSQDSNRKILGLSLAEIAKMWSYQPEVAVIKLLLMEQGEVTIIQHGMCEADIMQVLQWPYSMIGSDAGARMSVGTLAKGLPHPRTYGTFPRVINRYVKELKCLSLTEAIHKSTCLPATVFGLKNRGKIAPGYYADLVLFDYHSIKDHATYTQPFKPPSGILYVFVNGVLTINNSVLTGNLSGSFL